MAHSMSSGDLEADVAALRAAADRAGTALACLFSTSEEFETAVVCASWPHASMRRRHGIRRTMRSALWSAALALVFVMM